MGWGEYKYIYIKYYVDFVILEEDPGEDVYKCGRVCLKLRKELQAGNRNFTAHKGESVR